MVRYRRGSFYRIGDSDGSGSKLLCGGDWVCVGSTNIGTVSSMMQCQVHLELLSQ